ncbi:MAG: hypothetical protein E6J55_25845 [Deltaproteobacteria bacterium]|nr:MAG: hypothetical protein E6J55_25845 [Deltaproteobacteria bacterium]
MSSPRAFIRTGTGRGTLGVALLAGGLQIALHNRGIWIEDEGIVLETAARVARGEVLYRDVAAVILPGVFWVHAALFRLFGEGILPGRWAMVALFTAVCLLVYRYLARAAGDRVAWLGLGLILGFRLLAFPTWTIPNYTHWSLLFLILGLWLLQGYPASRSRSSALLRSSRARCVSAVWGPAWPSSLPAAAWSPAWCCSSSRPRADFGTSSRTSCRS